MSMKAVGWLSSKLGVNISGRDGDGGEEGYENPEAHRGTSPIELNTESSHAFSGGANDSGGQYRYEGDSFFGGTTSSPTGNGEENGVGRYLKQAGSAVSQYWNRLNIGGGGSSSSLGNNLASLVGSSAGSQPAFGGSSRPADPTARENTEIDENGLPVTKNWYFYNKELGRWDVTPEAPENIKREHAMKLREAEEERLGMKKVAPPPPPPPPPSGGGGMRGPPGAPGAAGAPPQGIFSGGNRAPGPHYAVPDFFNDTPRTAPQSCQHHAPAAAQQQPQQYPPPPQQQQYGNSLPSPPQQPPQAHQGYQQSYLQEPQPQAQRQPPSQYPPPASTGYHAQPPQQRVFGSGSTSAALSTHSPPAPAQNLYQHPQEQQPQQHSSPSPPSAIAPFQYTSTAGRTPLPGPSPKQPSPPVQPQLMQSSPPPQHPQPTPPAVPAPGQPSGQPSKNPFSGYCGDVGAADDLFTAPLQTSTSGSALPSAAPTFGHAPPPQAPQQPPLRSASQALFNAQSPSPDFLPQPQPSTQTPPAQRPAEPDAGPSQFAPPPPLPPQLQRPSVPTPDNGNSTHPACPPPQRSALGGGVGGQLGSRYAMPPTMGAMPTASASRNQPHTPSNAPVVTSPANQPPFPPPPPAQQVPQESASNPFAAAAGAAPPAPPELPIQYNQPHLQSLQQQQQPHSSGLSPAGKAPPPPPPSFKPFQPK